MDARAVLVLIVALGLAGILVLLLKQKRRSSAHWKGGRTAGPTGLAMQIIGDSGLLAEVRPAVEQAPTRRLEAINDRQVIAGIQALLQHAPSLLREAIALGTRTYIVRFAPHVMSGLSEGSLSVMQAIGGGLRASAVDASGRIVGNAVLSSPSAALNGALAVWQVLAIVTAQKFLAEINARLDGIERTAASIREWLEDEQHGRLSGSLKYMRSIANSLERCAPTEADVSAFCEQLESIVRSAHDIMAMQERKSIRLAAEFGALKLQGRGFDSRSMAVSELLSTFARASEPWCVAAQVRAVACHLRSRLPVSRHVSLLRVQELKADVDRQEAVGRELVETVKRRVSELNSAFTREKTAAEHQYRIRLEAANMEQRLIVSAKELGAVAGQLERELQHADVVSGTQAELLVTVDEAGSLVRVERALPSAA